MTVEYIGDGNSDGTCVGRTTSELVAFHGSTPTDQYAVVTNTSGTLGNTNDAVDSIIALLQEKGLMAT
tara:strand:- start:9971 stop:10174 length:204 start_codon:yes stop_codon:yes gene_type:complete